MLVNLNAEIYELKLQLLTASGAVEPEQLILKGQLDQKLTLRIWMVLGEGAVFVSILLLGFWAVKKSIAKEFAVAEQQKNFLLSVTHELKSPLAAIKLQLQTLRSRSLPAEKQQQIYDRALHDADRLEKLVENLLLVNKVESGGLPLNRQLVNVSELIERQLRATHLSEIEAGRIKLDIQPNVKCKVDEMAIQSIVLNLTSNAIKYGAESTVTVSVKVGKEQELLLVVEDVGTGIPDSEKQKVFDRFYRLGNEDVRKTKGTGIGLYIVKLLVEKHNGSIALQDNKPSGTRFLISLPMDMA